MDEGDYDGDTIPGYQDGEFTTVTGFNHELVWRRGLAIMNDIEARRMGNASLLELGPADGGMTPCFDRQMEHLELAVVSSQRTVQDIAEDGVRFDIVTACHILEHLRKHEQRDFLRSVRKVMSKNNGDLYVSVPNAGSLHRVVGVKRGVIKSVYDLGPRDKKAGHRKVFDVVQLGRLLDDHHFKVTARLPVLVKPFPDSSMEDLTGHHLDQLADMAVALPGDGACRPNAGLQRRSPSQPN